MSAFERYLIQRSLAQMIVVINPQDAEDSTVPGVTIVPSRECQRHHLLVSEETI